MSQIHPADRLVACNLVEQAAAAEAARLHADRSEADLRAAIRALPAEEQPEVHRLMASAMFAVREATRRDTELWYQRSSFADGLVRYGGFTIAEAESIAADPSSISDDGAE